MIALGLTGCTAEVSPAAPEEGASVVAVDQALSEPAPQSPAQAEPGTLADLLSRAPTARIAPSTYVPFPKPAVTDFTGRQRDRVLVKFVEGSHVRLRNGRLTIDLSGVGADVQTEEVDRLSRSGFTRSSAAAELAHVVATLAQVPGLGLEPSFTGPEADLAEMKASGEARAGIELADLSLSYDLHVGEADAPALVDALNASPLVEIAYPAPISVPAATDLAPTTSSYVGNQNYLDSSPRAVTSTQSGGVDARFAWTRTGGTGSNVRIIDVEHAWNTQHEDLGAGGNNGPAVSLGVTTCE